MRSAAKADGALADAIYKLTAYISDDKLYDLVVDIYRALLRLVADATALERLADVTHSTTTIQQPSRSERASPVFNGTQGQAVAVPGLLVAPLLIGDLRGEQQQQQSAAAAGAASNLSGGGRRRLLQSKKFPLPAGFTPAKASALPAVRLPVCFHVFMYNDGFGGVGERRNGRY